MRIGEAGDRSQRTFFRSFPLTQLVERAGDAKLVAELKATRETAINAYMESMLARSEITPLPSGSTA
jgi:hypothetical protein